MVGSSTNMPAWLMIVLGVSGLGWFYFLNLFYTRTRFGRWFMRLDRPGLRGAWGRGTITIVTIGGLLLSTVFIVVGLVRLFV